MKKCDYCDVEGACCDFCRMFNYNGTKSGIYVGNGYCVFKEEDKDPIDVCDDFICMNYKMHGEIHPRFRKKEGKS